MHNSNNHNIALHLLQVALASSKQEQESNDTEWDARHQEAVDSAEQWKEFADKLSKEKEEQQQQLASASANLQASTTTLGSCDTKLQHSFFHWLFHSFHSLLACLLACLDQGLARTKKLHSTAFRLVCYGQVYTTSAQWTWTDPYTVCHVLLQLLLDA